MIGTGNHRTATFVPRNSIPVPLSEDCSVSSLLWVVVGDPPHGSAVAYVIAAAHKRKELFHAGARLVGMLRLVIRPIGVIGVCPVIVIDRGQAHPRLHDVAAGGLRSVMVNDVLDPIPP